MTDSSDSNSEISLHTDDFIVGSSTSYPQVVLLAGHNRWEWAFLSVSILSAIILASSCASVKNCEGIFSPLEICFMLEVLVGLISGISLVFAVYGVYFERQYDMYLHCSCVFLALFFSWISFARQQSNLTDVYVLIKLAINITVTVLCIISFLLAFKATHMLDWIEFRLIGVSDAMAAMYKNQCYFLAVLKLHSVLLVAFAMYSVVVFHIYSKYWGYYLGLIILYAALTYILGYVAERKESCLLVYVFHFMNFCFAVFIIYQYLKHYLTTGYPSDLGQIIYYSSIPYGILLIVCEGYLMALIRKTQQGFGYGLNSRSFLDLVSKDSNNLVANNRSAVMF